MYTSSYSRNELKETIMKLSSTYTPVIEVDYFLQFSLYIVVNKFETLVWIHR